jgi:NAD(P)-dependent dehydrogenase (short-subunit alcohol dehydrogenase family)
MTDLSNRHVIVTGGSRGIGLSIALACKKAGANVTVLARSEKDLALAEAELKKVRPEAKCLAIRADVTDDKELTNAFQKSAEAFGPLYGLICASGVYGAIGPFSSVNFEDWEKTISINLTGTARTIHRALKHMTKPEGARIIVFSGGGQGPMPNFSDYVTSKGAIWRLTETLGAELAPKKIYLNAIAPGAVNTRLLDELIDAGPDRVGKEYYEKSLQQRETGGQSPDKAAELTLYFLSEKSAGLYGKTLSAVWDRYQEFENLEQISKSDLFCYRRVVDAKGNTRG